MNDFQIIIRSKRGKIGIDAGGEKIEMEDLAVTCGVIQILAGEMALKMGKSIDDVQDALLDIHLSAMTKLQETAEETEMWNE